MRGLGLLREHLLEKLKKPAEKLITFVENGTVITVPGEDNKDFQINYQGVIYILGIKYDARYICWIVGEWMNAYQPDHTTSDIQFDAEILNHDTVDLEFRIDFKEIVKVTQDENGTTFTSCFDGLEDIPALDVSINYQ